MSRPGYQRHRTSLQLPGWSKMEKDRPPQLMTPASVKAIISRIEAAQLTRAQEVILEMKELPFYWDLMWRLGTDHRLGQESSSGPSGVLGSSVSWVCRQINPKYPSPRLGLCWANWNKTTPMRQGTGREQPIKKTQDGPETPSDKS